MSTVFFQEDNQIRSCTLKVLEHQTREWFDST
ncbi:hypothetical protein CPT_Mendera_136 [Stenotrophomonas phage Mendera]|uniref:Uncharacterized protein n=1 Tax=Stenotrophomonas phage Mendera TaxID=2650877 RepID=A0A5P8PIW4_9CAUD|nr:hypothetical protein HWC60_gp263 [Stenotrophomonas phage Mendera]QFR56678.1 hypothetical protein CPT_Mendera_136 [Stenotrophomonas phage Mendera]